MDSLREGTLTTRPLVLDGAIYSYWKARVITFLKSIDNKCWKVAIGGWEPPSTRDVVRKVIIKPKISWSKQEDEHLLETLGL